MNFDEAIALRPQLSGYAYRLTGNRDDAADLVQSTMLRAWRFRDSYKEGHLKRWLMRIMRNVHFDRGRCKDDKFSEAIDVNACEWLHQEYPCAGEHLVQFCEVERLLSGLNTNRMEALLLTRAGYGYEELAAIQGVAVGTIKSRVSRGEADLVEAMA